MLMFKNWQLTEYCVEFCSTPLTLVQHQITVYWFIRRASHVWLNCPGLLGDHDGTISGIISLLAIDCHVKPACSKHMWCVNVKKINSFSSIYIPPVCSSPHVTTWPYMVIGPCLLPAQLSDRQSTWSIHQFGLFQAPTSTKDVLIFKAYQHI